jgi:hypothetical protein
MSSLTCPGQAQSVTPDPLEDRKQRSKRHHGSRRKSGWGRRRTIDGPAAGCLPAWGIGRNAKQLEKIRPVVDELMDNTVQPPAADVLF